MITIGNDRLQARIHPHGAELQSLQAHGLEYMWRGDAAWWGKHSPILFPIVGQLRNDMYRYDGKSYQLPRHGFAREMDFAVTHTDAASAVFTLQSSDATKAVYPFDFILRLKYVVDNDTLTVTYEVENTGDTAMLFSIGAHPAFAVPLTAGTAYNDYFLEFSVKETAPRWQISNGLIDAPAPLLEHDDCLPLTHDLFYKDALVFKQLQSGYVSLRSERMPHGLTMDISEFSYMGIWAAKDAPFVCLEPWQGIADAVQHDGRLETKEGMMQLPAGQQKSFSWSVKCF